MRKVLFPGSFDPITKGHMDVIEQAMDMFDGVVVAVLQNSLKDKGLFTIEERMEIINELYKNVNNIEVVSGTCAVDLAMLYECKAMIRGLRSSKDYDDEYALQQFNKEISDNKVNTICFFADIKYQLVSSSSVKSIFNLNKDISRYVDPMVKEKMLIKKRSVER